MWRQTRQNVVWKSNKFSTLFKYLYSITLTLIKQIIILNLPGFRSTLLTNDEYVMNSSHFMTDLPVVSSSLDAQLKNMYFKRLSENTQSLLNCLRQHSGFYCVASSHGKKIVLRITHWDHLTTVKCRLCSDFFSSVYPTAVNMSLVCSPLYRSPSCDVEQLPCFTDDDAGSFVISMLLQD